jgi:preprotein translocase SecE subunit
MIASKLESISQTISAIMMEAINTTIALLVSSSLSARANYILNMKIINYIKESYTELVHKVSWPSRSELTNSAIVVLIASIIIASLSQNFRNKGIGMFRPQIVTLLFQRVNHLIMIKELG